MGEAVNKGSFTDRLERYRFDTIEKIFTHEGLPATWYQSDDFKVLEISGVVVFSRIFLKEKGHADSDGWWYMDEFQLTQQLNGIPLDTSKFKYPNS